jgi:hypothetical protein
MLIRNAIIATSTTLEIEIPAEYVGKIVEYTIKDLPAENEKVSFGKLTQHLRYRSGGYQFNRNEANDYPINYGSR